MSDPYALETLPDGKAHDPNALAPVPVDWADGGYALGLTGHPDDAALPINEWQRGTGGGAARADYAIVIASATSSDWETGSVSAVKGGTAYRIRATQSCCVRLYRSADTRDADLARALGDPVTPGTGVLADVGLSGDNDRDQWLSEPADVYNADDPVAATLYWAVFNTMDADLPITVTITILPLET